MSAIKFENRAGFLVGILLEAAAIRRRPNSKIPRFLFQIYQELHHLVSVPFISDLVLCPLSLCTLIASSAVYIFVEDGNKMMTVAILTMAWQCLMCNAIFAKRCRQFDALFDASDGILRQVVMTDHTLKVLEDADRKSVRFTKVFATVLISNIIAAAAQGAFKTLTRGRPHAPAEVSCLGLSTGPCWAMQLTVGLHTVFFVTFYFSLMKIFVYQLSAYSKILSKHFETRFPSNEEVEDVKLFKAHCDVVRFATSFINIFGLPAFIELQSTVVRNAFQSYHVLMTITQNEWAAASQSIVGLLSSNLFPYLVCACGEEILETTETLKQGILRSNWYQSSPAIRRRLVLILTFLQEPIRFHYRHIVFFNREMFTEVLQSTYSLITAMANFM